MSALLPETELPGGLFSVEIPANGLALDPAECALACGYPVDRIPEYFYAMAESAEQSIRERISIRAGYVLAALEITDRRKHRFQIGQIGFAADRRLMGYLGSCSQAAVFLCSLGPQVDAHLDALQCSGDLATAFIGNTLAALLAEHATHALHEHIRHAVGEHGLGVTNRYSPGYCNWGVSQQRALFELFPSGFCGVQLTESCLMLPIKSVSGIIGVGRDARIRSYDCEHCSQSDCNYRTVKQHRLNTAVLS